MSTMRTSDESRGWAPEAQRLGAVTARASLDGIQVDEFQRFVVS